MSPIEITAKHSRRVIKAVTKQRYCIRNNYGGFVQTASDPETASFSPNGQPGKRNFDLIIYSALLDYEASNNTEEIEAAIHKEDTWWVTDYNVQNLILFKVSQKRRRLNSEKLTSIGAESSKKLTICSIPKSVLN